MELRMAFLYGDVVRLKLLYVKEQLKIIKRIVNVQLLLVLLHCIEKSPGPDFTKVSAHPVICCSDESDECLDSNTLWLSDTLWHCF